jgi:membrane protease subunit HflK
MWRIVLIILGGIFLIWTAATSLTQVQPGERAVIRRFGRLLEHQPDQGLYIGWPWGIERVDLVKVGKVRTLSVGFAGKDEDEEAMPAGQMLTGDHNLVNVQASINYRVVDPEKYVLQQEAIDGFVAGAAESALTEWIAAYKIDDVIRIGKSQLPAFLHDRLDARLKKYDLGIEIETVNVPTLEPPKAVKDAFDSVAQAEKAMTSKRDQAETRANLLRDQASAEIKKISRFAHAYEKTEVTTARTDADNFVKRLAQYRELSQKNPNYLNAVWLDEMTRLYQIMRENGRVELLDHFLTEGGLTITEFPLPRKK